jgi:hypothetical protein
MQYKVPQNVQREDTIVGPLTLKQLAILGIGGGITYSVYLTLAQTYFIEVWIWPVAILGILTLLFAFIRPFNLSFFEFLLHLIEYKSLPQKRVWQKKSDDPLVLNVSEKQKKAVKKELEKNKPKQKSLEELTKMIDGKNQ